MLTFWRKGGMLFSMLISCYSCRITKQPFCRLLWHLLAKASWLTTRFFFFILYFLWRRACTPRIVFHVYPTRDLRHGFVMKVLESETSLPFIGLEEWGGYEWTINPSNIVLINRINNTVFNIHIFLNSTCKRCSKASSN